MIASFKGHHVFHLLQILCVAVIFPQKFVYSTNTCFIPPNSSFIHSCFIPPNVCFVPPNSSFIPPNSCCIPPNSCFMLPNSCFIPRIPVLFHRIPVLFHRIPVLFHRMSALFRRIPVLFHRIPVLFHPIPVLFHECLFYSTEFQFIPPNFIGFGNSKYFQFTMFKYEAFMGTFVKREDRRPKGTNESVLHTLVDVSKLSLLVALRGAE